MILLTTTIGLSLILFLPHQCAGYSYEEAVGIWRNEHCFFPPTSLYDSGDNRDIGNNDGPLTLLRTCKSEQYQNEPQFARKLCRKFLKLSVEICRINAEDLGCSSKFSDDVLKELFNEQFVLDNLNISSVCDVLRQDPHLHADEKTCTKFCEISTKSNSALCSLFAATMIQKTTIIEKCSSSTFTGNIDGEDSGSEGKPSGVIIKTTSEPTNVLTTASETPMVTRNKTTTEIPISMHNGPPLLPESSSYADDSFNNKINKMSENPEIFIKITTERNTKTTPMKIILPQIPTSKHIPTSKPTEVNTQIHAQTSTLKSERNDNAVTLQTDQPQTVKPEWIIDNANTVTQQPDQPQTVKPEGNKNNTNVVTLQPTQPQTDKSEGSKKNPNAVTLQPTQPPTLKPDLSSEYANAVTPQPIHSQTTQTETSYDDDNVTTMQPNHSEITVPEVIIQTVKDATRKPTLPKEQTDTSSAEPNKSEKVNTSKPSTTTKITEQNPSTDKPTVGILKTTRNITPKPTHDITQKSTPNISPNPASNLTPKPSPHITMKSMTDINTKSTTKTTPTLTTKITTKLTTRTNTKSTSPISLNPTHTQNLPSLSDTDNPAVGVPRINFPNDFDFESHTEYKDRDTKAETSNASALIVLLLVAIGVIIGYVIYHKKEKIKLYLVSLQTSTRGVKYTKLKPDVEEFMPSLEQRASAKAFIY